MQDSISPCNELNLSNGNYFSTSSMGMYIMEYHNLKGSSLDDEISSREKQVQFQTSKNKKENEKIHPEFLDGLLVFAPDRRDSILKSFRERSDFSLDNKIKRREATIANVSHPWRL
jgi:hypothetical protein